MDRVKTTVSKPKFNSKNTICYCSTTPIKFVNQLYCEPKVKMTIALQRIRINKNIWQEQEQDIFQYREVYSIFDSVDYSWYLPGNILNENNNNETIIPQLQIINMRTNMAIWMHPPMVHRIILEVGNSESSFIHI